MTGASTETGAADCCRTPLGGVRPRREREPIVDAADERRVYSRGPGPKLAALVSRTVLSSDDTKRLSSQASAPHDAPKGVANQIERGDRAIVAKRQILRRESFHPELTLGGRTLAELAHSPGTPGPRRLLSGGRGSRKRGQRAILAHAPHR